MFWRFEHQSNWNLFVAGQAVLQTSLLCEALSDAIRPLTPPIPPSKLVARLVVEQNPEIQPAVGSFMPSGRATSQKSLGFLRPSTWVAPATCFRSEATAFEQGVRRKLFEARFPTRYLKSNPMTDKTSWTRCLQTTPISVEVSETWCCVRTSCTK
jgi:hypothetical protein